MRTVRIAHLGAELSADVARLWRTCFPGEARHAHPAGHPWDGAMTAPLVERRIRARTAFDPAGSFVAVVNGRVVGYKMRKDL